MRMKRLARGMHGQRAPPRRWWGAHLDGGVEVHGLAGGGGRRGLLHGTRALPSAAGGSEGAALGGRRRDAVGQQRTLLCSNVQMFAFQSRQLRTRQTCWSSTDELSPCVFFLWKRACGGRR